MLSRYDALSVVGVGFEEPAGPDLLYHSPSQHTQARLCDMQMSQGGTRWQGGDRDSGAPDLFLEVLDLLLEQSDQDCRVGLLVGCHLQPKNYTIDIPQAEVGPRSQIARIALPDQQHFNLVCS